jgi:seryl-tRNA synthetase
MYYDFKYVKENRDALVDSIKNRSLPFKGSEVNRLIELYERIKKEQLEIDSVRHERNLIGKLKGENEKKNEQAKKLKLHLDELEKSIEKEQAEANALFLILPNIIESSVPIAKDETGNVEIKKWGKIPEKNFTVKSAEELAESKGMLDIERAAKITGSRFAFLEGKVAELALALQLYSMKKIADKGYTAVIPPFLMKEDVYKGIAHMLTFEDALYRVSGREEDSEDIRYLISTTEHPLIAMYGGETLDESALPIKLIGESPAFRKEAGAHGHDTKGIFRLHQFDQTEQIAICKPEESEKIQKEFLANEEEMLQELKIPYRVIILCSGDMGIRDYKQYDVEAYMPFQKNYREVMSNDNCTDWISRRSDIKYVDKNGNKRYAHTVDATGLPIQRMIKVIMENHQKSDGTVEIPEVLAKYTGFKEL